MLRANGAKSWNYFQMDVNICQLNRTYTIPDITSDFVRVRSVESTTCFAFFVSIGN
jgi:hypothetical protein